MLPPDTFDGLVVATFWPACLPPEGSIFCADPDFKFTRGLPNAELLGPSFSLGNMLGAVPLPGTCDSIPFERPLAPEFVDVSGCEFVDPLEFLESALADPCPAASGAVESFCAEPEVPTVE